MRSDRTANHPIGHLVAGDVRHTFATRYLEAGGTLAELRDLLGHRNIATTDRYVHSNAARVRERIEEL